MTATVLMWIGGGLFVLVTLLGGMVVRSGHGRLGELVRRFEACSMRCVEGRERLSVVETQVQNAVIQHGELLDRLKRIEDKLDALVATGRRA